MKVITKEGKQFIRDTHNGWLIAVDWEWKSARPGDTWTPKPKFAGRELSITGALGIKEFRCESLTIVQVHHADKAVLAKDECDRLRSIKVRALKRHWKPDTVRSTEAI